MGLPNGKLKLVLVNFNMDEAAKSFATRPGGPNYLAWHGMTIVRKLKLGCVESLHWLQNSWARQKGDSQHSTQHSTQHSSSVTRGHKTCYRLRFADAGGCHLRGSVGQFARDCLAAPEPDPGLPFAAEHMNTSHGQKYLETTRVILRNTTVPSCPWSMSSCLCIGESKNDG